MSENIGQRELRNDSEAIMRGLDEDRSYVITRDGAPVGELRPPRRQRFVDGRVIAELFKDAPSLDAEAFRRELDELIDQDPFSRG